MNVEYAHSVASTPYRVHVSLAPEAIQRPEGSTQILRWRKIGRLIFAYVLAALIGAGAFLGYAVAESYPQLSWQLFALSLAMTPLSYMTFVRMDGWKRLFG
jgi:hypothetical protein